VGRVCRRGRWRFRETEREREREGGRDKCGEIMMAAGWGAVGQLGECARDGPFSGNRHYPHLPHTDSMFYDRHAQDNDGKKHSNWYHLLIKTRRCHEKSLSPQPT
jgi:hypothetical protein